MEAFTRIQNFIKNLDEKELFSYFTLFGLALLSIVGTILYFNYSGITKYKNKIAAINDERRKTKRILTDFKLVNQQKQKVDAILSKDEHFYIAQEFNNLIKKLGLTKNLSEEPSKSDGEIISGKVERIITAHLDSISMKQLTELLAQIAEIERLYPKELIIKKVPNSKKIDVDLVVATLETLSEPE